MTLNDNIERDYRVPVEITDIPSDVNFVIAPPEFINVNVKGKGSGLVRYSLLGTPSLKLKFDQFESLSANSAKLSSVTLRQYIRKIFNGEDYVMTIDH